MISNDLQPIKEVPVKRKRVSVSDADLLGRKFERWTVLEISKNVHGNPVCMCRCSCEKHKVKVVSRWDLLAGKSKSCGCIQREIVTTHGMTGTSTYRTWWGMIERCTNPKNTKYADYGGRGIIVCDRWRIGDVTKSGFECFLADMGKRPPGTSLDRRDNNGHYDPINCRWISHREQCNNTRRNRHFTYLGRTQTIAQWAKESGVRWHVISWRIDRGWDAERVFSAPVPQKHSAITHLGRTQPLGKWARELGLKWATLNYRLNQGWSVERALSTPAQQRKTKAKANHRADTPKLLVAWQEDGR